MLQPLQLEDVSARHAGDIAELRDFFHKAGIAVETPRALHAVVAQVRDDRGFHRDFTSHVWVLLNRAGRQAAYPDLLAVAVLAAAGVEFAPTAAETDALDLLRFLMEAIRSLDAEGEDDGGLAFPPVVPVAHTPEVRPEPRLAEWAVTPQQARLRPQPQPQPGPQPGPQLGPRTAWVVAAVCLLAAITFGVLLVRRTGTRVVADVARAPQPGGTATSSAGEGTDFVVVPPVDEGVPLAGQIAAAARARNQDNPRHARVSPVRKRVHAAPVFRVAPAAPVTMASVTRVAPPASLSLTAPARTADSSNAPTTAPRTVASGRFKIVPADELSRRIGARGIPAYAEEDARNNAGGERVPQLLRRQTSGNGQGSSETELVAEVQPPARPGSSRAANTGIVRSGSLGVMAANVVYSPTPVYPSAASAARVQGEVRLQAEVDRNGNVTDARVVSGPPLLRDAALNAVQHWRYRPWLWHGKPVPTTAAAVLEFELH